jgi:hypothetical protein
MNPGLRVKSFVAPSNLEMQVRPRGPSRASNGSQKVSLSDGVSPSDGTLFQVAVPGGKVFLVLDDNQVAVPVTVEL